MKDAVTRKKIFFIPRADEFDERWTADVQLNGECACRITMAAALQGLLPGGDRR